MKFLGLKKSDYREHDFHHPEEDVHHHRWELLFERENELFDDSFEEDEDNCRTVVVSTYATSYSKSETQSEEEAIADIKHSIMCAYKGWSMGIEVFRWSWVDKSICDWHRVW